SSSPTERGRQPQKGHDHEPGPDHQGGCHRAERGRRRRPRAPARLGAGEVLRDRMARLVEQMEADPADASPTAGTGALQYGADVERALQEWACKRDILRTVRLVRRAVEPAPAPGPARGA